MESSPQKPTDMRPRRRAEDLTALMRSEICPRLTAPPGRDPRRFPVGCAAPQSVCSRQHVPGRTQYPYTAPPDIRAFTLLAPQGRQAHGKEADVFQLQLDFCLHYIPPMDESGPGILLTRTLELPFPPSPGIALWGKELDQCDEPLGFVLKDLIWDVDRETFLATTYLVSHDLPIATIPDDIRAWMDRGWRLGSYMDAYGTPAEEEEEQHSDQEEDDEWEEMEQWPRKRPRARPRHFNRTLMALVRAMAECYNNLPEAYAIHKTKRFFAEDEIANSNSTAAKRYRDARQEYLTMSLDEQLNWREQVTRRCPRLDRIIAAM